MLSDLKPNSCEWLGDVVLKEIPSASFYAEFAPCTFFWQLVCDGDGTQ